MPVPALPHTHTHQRSCHCKLHIQFSYPTHLNTAPHMYTASCLAPSGHPARAPWEGGRPATPSLQLVSLASLPPGLGWRGKTPPPQALRHWTQFSSHGEDDSAEQSDASVHTCCTSPHRQHNTGHLACVQPDHSPNTTPHPHTVAAAEGEGLVADGKGEARMAYYPSLLVEASSSSAAPPGPERLHPQEAAAAAPPSRAPPAQLTRACQRW